MIDHFGDVGRVIAAAFHVLGDEQQMRAHADGARIFHHVGEQFAKQAVVDFVDLAILVPHRFRQFGVAVGIGIQHLLELAEGGAAHAGQRLGQADRRLAVEHDGALGDILGQVADALQLGGGLDRRQRLAQIHRHGLAQRQQLQGAVFDILLHGVNAGIAANGAFRRHAVTAGHRLDRGRELGFRQAAHLGHQRGKSFKLLGKRLDGMICHRDSGVRSPYGDRGVRPSLCDSFITFP